MENSTKSDKVGLGLVKHKEPVTVEELQKLFPKKKNTITEETAEIINKTINDPSFNGYSLMQTLVDYQGVMYNNKGSIGDYINAIRFCSFLENESDSTVKAYIKTFSHRDFVKERMDADFESVGYRELTSAASRYRKSPMVRAILTQADVPLYLLFRGYTYKAVEVLAETMQKAKLDRDRINAAKELLAAVKPPENMKIELGVGPNQEAIDLNAQLSRQLAESVAMQRKMLEAGMDFSEATRLNIQLNDVEEAEVIDDDE